MRLKICLYHTTLYFYLFPGVSDIAVSVITQQEVMIGHRFTAFALLYKATTTAAATATNHDELHKCRNFRPAFYEALSERVAAELTTIDGRPFNVLSMEQAIGAIDKAEAFSLVLTEPLRRLDEALLVDAIQEAWVAAFTGR
jgi:hypothetical protein